MWLFCLLFLVLLKMRQNYLLSFLALRMNEILKCYNRWCYSKRIDNEQVNTFEFLAELWFNLYHEQLDLPVLDWEKMSSYFTNYLEKKKKGSNPPAMTWIRNPMGSIKTLQQADTRSLDLCFNIISKNPDPGHLCPLCPWTWFISNFPPLYWGLGRE